MAKGCKTYRNLLITAATLLLLSGCGARVDGWNLNLDANNSHYSLSVNVSQSVWHDGNIIIGLNTVGAGSAKVLLIPSLVMEDGNSYGNVIVTNTKINEKDSAIYGIYQVDISDADKIVFKSKVGFPYNASPTDSVLIFRISVQEGDSFPVLSEIEAVHNNQIKIMEADLTPFRGRNKFIILSVQSKGETSSPVDGVWIDPKIYYEYLN